MPRDKVKAKLINAFSDNNYQEYLLKIRLAIEGALLSFLKDAKSSLPPEHKVFDNIESRVKSIESFQEKIERKEYISQWDVPDNKQAIQEYISANLPDLIGFRINCFFWDDEEELYERIQKYYDDGNFHDIKLCFDENTTQKNGHKIYKLTGKYMDKYCFEVQIKSIMHNIWGEVDHKTIYKGRNYDPDIASKSVITSELFNILQASDKQLVSLFTKRISEQELVNSLFFEYTKVYLQEVLGTDILVEHYASFFKIFTNTNSETVQLIRKYVACQLLHTSYDLQPLPQPVRRDAARFAEKINVKFREFYINCLYSIAGTLYNIVDLNQFTIFLADTILRTYLFSEDEPDSEDSNSSDAFGDDQDEELPDHDYSALIEKMKEIVGGYIDGKTHGKTQAN